MLFTTADKRLFITAKDKVALVYFSENNKPLLDLYPKMNIPIAYIRNILIPRFIYKFIRMVPKGSQLQAIRIAYKLMPFMKEDKILDVGRPFYFDFNPLISTIHNKFTNLRQNVPFVMLSNILNNYIKEFNAKGYKTIVMYHVNTRQAFDKNIFKRKIFPFLKQIQLGSNYFDEMFLLNENLDSVTYRLLYRKNDERFSMSKLFSFLKIMKFDVPENTSEEMTKELPDEKDSEITPTTDNVVVTPPSVSETDGNMLKNNKKFREEKDTIDDESIKEVVRSNITSGKTKELQKEIKTDDDIAVELLKHTLNTPEEIAKKAVTKHGPKAVIEKTKEFMLPSFDIQNRSKHPLTKNVDLKKIHNNQLLNNVMVKRINEVTQLQDEYVEEILGSYKDKDIPVKLLGVTKEIVQSSSTEIFKSVFIQYNAKMKLANGQIQNIRFKVPAIIENNYIYINGMKKVLINQLIANPIYFPKPYLAYVHSIYATIRLEYKAFKEPYFSLFCSGLKMPFMIGFLAAFGEEGLYSSFGIKIVRGDVVDQDKISVKLKTKDSKISVVFENKEWEILKNDFIRVAKYTIKFMDGKYIWNNVISAMTGSKNAKYNVQTVHANIIDKQTKEILLSNNEPTNIIDIYKFIIPKLMEGYFQARNDISKMRVRSTEIIPMAIKQVFDLAYSRYNGETKLRNKAVKLEIDQNRIMSDILTSALTQTAEYVNPLEQISTITRVTYRGVGGIDAKAELLEMRGVHPEYFGNIDPIDTPQSSAIGMVQNLTNGANFRTKYGHLVSKKIDDNLKTGMLSPTTSLIPFIENNEPTRMIMASNQMKQSLPIIYNEVPAVQTGYESFIANYCSGEFIVTAEGSGKVIEVSDNKIKIQYKTGEIDEVDVGRVVLRSGQSYHSISELKSEVQTGDVVKAGQVLASNHLFKNGQLALGRNLLCAFMQWKGANFEDGIIIRKGLAEEQALTSRHSMVYEIFLSQKDELIDYNIEMDGKIDDRHILVEFVPENIVPLLGEMDEYGDLDITTEKTITLKSTKGIIYSVEVFCNHKSLNPTMTKLVNKFGNPKRVGQYTIRGEKIDGTMIKVYVETEKDIKDGDKLSNRYGNKGVITLMEDDDKMPVTPWGDKIDIILNPFGIYGRINMGQVFELYCGLISKRIADESRNLTKIAFTKLMVRIMTQLDNTADKKIKKEVINSLMKMSEKDFQVLRNEKFFPIIVPPFDAPKTKHIMEVIKILGLKTKYKLHLPEYNMKTKDGVPVGYMFIQKLEHMAEKKLSVRSVGAYSQKTKQPSAASKERGQMVGEMDSWVLSAYGAEKIIKELFGPASDDMALKRKMMTDILMNGHANLPDQRKINPALELTEDYMIIIGLEETSVL